MQTVRGQLGNSGEGGAGAQAHTFENRLIDEKSPYLLQHAHNPVDWYPWGEEAFEKARREDKPIFLSIGYSTCHWCHVMERETFENEEAAKLMNEVFVSIKVDREERPDIDHIYMTVCQMMTGAGGWPLSIIMTPERKPFFAATYIPRETRFGRIGMMELTPRIKEIWNTRRDEVLNSANTVVQALRDSTAPAKGEALDRDVPRQAYEQLAQRFDGQYGGFSDAPKFPTPHIMLFLLRYWKRSGDERALRMVETTLRNMRLGGVYDHVGFGFHRYSTDSEWLLPHFEKMLYDQALLALAHIEAFQVTGKEEYRRTAEEIFTYVLRDMTDERGGFHSAEDADSEGEEGKFYVWELGELERVLGADDARIAAEVFNVERAGNFREEATGRVTGANILHLKKPIAEIAAEKGIDEGELRDRIETIRRTLFDHREKRVHPHKDDKVLTDWNGLMIAALSRGAQVFGRSDYADAAGKAADFILATLRDDRGRLLHRYREGEAGIDALVDDYAFFVWGLLDLYETTFDVRYLEAALELNADFLGRFWDREAGGFYFTAEDATDALVRKKDLYDGATPSGNSVAAWNLLRLARMTADTDLEKRADEMMNAFAGSIRQFPSVYTQFLIALDFVLGPSYEVVIAGDPAGRDTEAMLDTLRQPFIPNKAVLLRPAGEETPKIAELAEYTKAQTSWNGQATAYVCLNFNCELPTTDPTKMLELLGVKRP